MSRENRDSPGVLLPPPLIYAVVFGAGLYLSRFVWRPDLTRGLLIAATALLAVAFLIALWALLQMQRARTAISPYHPTTSIVTTGPFARSRNPVYVALSLVYIAFCLLFRATVALALLPVAILWLHAAIIRREERYLEEKFGEEYRVYRARVRRWM